MARTPTPEPDGPVADDDAEVAAAPERVGPRIDVSPALHEAGHEVADLGFEGLPDDGPVLHPEQGPVGPADPLDFVNVQIPSD
ncbi:MAG: hypothetical protein FJW95_15760 [Actinobacteria bacterium]|nr:hypothetical protein [Actinomycetota bacterium]